MFSALQEEKLFRHSPRFIAKNFASIYYTREGRMRREAKNSVAGCCFKALQGWEIQGNVLNQCSDNASRIPQTVQKINNPRMHASTARIFSFQISRNPAKNFNYLLIRSWVNMTQLFLASILPKINYCKLFLSSALTWLCLMNNSPELTRRNFQNFVRSISVTSQR